MLRRDFLKLSGAFTAQLIGGSFIVQSSLLSHAQAITGLPLVRLRARVSEHEALILTPDDSLFQKYNFAMNLRTVLTPEVRILCRTARAVSETVMWAQENKIQFALRGGGHSYEGLSQSSHLVIDSRAMNGFSISDDGTMIRVGAGLSLGEIYQAIGPRGRVIPAGSCPPVGVSGHTLGGGFGLLARRFGLACDSLTSVEIVTADGRLLNASATENADLFWALRGGGGGSFGVVTEFNFKTHELSHVSTFGVSWVVSAAQAQRVMQAWQNWAPHAPASITSIFRLSRTGSNQIAIRCAGQSTDSVQAVQRELAQWIQIEAPNSATVKAHTFLEAVAHFSGGDAYQSAFVKGRSDYLSGAMLPQGIETLLNGLLSVPVGSVVVICDSYGGAIQDVDVKATAFAHRKAQYSIQYYSQWVRAEDTESHILHSRLLYQSMRPFVSGGAYVNYCDSELPNYSQAYWGVNLPSLMSVKAKYDPDNFFRHAQSVPSL
jgi:FAD/FMN-containing dehydrogenase